MNELMRDGIDVAATTLLHSLWQGTLVAAVLFVALKVIPRSAATLRYGWGVAAMALLVVSMAITFLSSFELAPTAVEYQLGAQVGSEHGMAEASAFASSTEEMVGSWQIWAVLGWMVGAGIFSLRLGGAWWGVRQLRAQSLPVADGDMLRCFERLRARLGISRHVILRRSSAIDSPLTLGWWRPVVLVPVSMISALPLHH
jgi:beta-lactamase regulating signal transducer with metallopeptidase domain